MIRQIYSTLIEDYLNELTTIGVDTGKQELMEIINSQQTYKFSNLNKESVYFLTEYAQKNDYTFWGSENHQSLSIILSFPHPRAMRDLKEECIKQNLSLTAEIGDYLERTQQERWDLLLPNRKLKIDKPLIMGILNVTPDSFSDGGNYFQPDQAYRRAVEMLEAEVDIIDIGAESTRPGAVGISVQEEWGRLEPIIKKIRKKIDLPLSIDTYKSEIALQALNEGVDMVNDISGLTFDQHMTEVVAKFRSPIILMHIKGTPRNMQTNPHYENILEEIYFFLAKQVSYSLNNGIKQIIIDPGIGFGKRLKDNFEIIRRLPEFKGLGLPILVGPSRKSFIGNTLNLPPNDRLTGTIAAVTACILQGANIVRVHDVEEIKQVVIIARSIMTQKA